MVADFDRTNAEKLVEGADVIVDGLDNFESRFLINDVALKLGIPWVYGGAIAATGMTATFLPAEQPCFRCLVSSPPAGGSLTCETAGVVNAVPWIVGSLEAAEALKILAGTAPPVSATWWCSTLGAVVSSRCLWPISPRADCPACRRHLRVPRGASRAPGSPAFADRTPCRSGTPPHGYAPGADQGAAERAGAGGRRRADAPLPVGEQELVVFHDGRTIVRGTRDEKVAKALYAKYVGM